MIRINLLPVKQAQKRSLGQQQIILAVIAIVAVVALLYTGNQREKSKITGLQAKVNDLKTELSKLDDLIGDAEEVKKREAELQKKLNVINKLKASKTGPVRMLDELSTILPRKLWLTSFKIGGAMIQLSGVAVSNKDIAVFMRNLESSPFFTGVQLKEVKAHPAKKMAVGADVEFLSIFKMSVKYIKPSS